MEFHFGLKGLKKKLSSGTSNTLKYKFVKASIVVAVCKLNFLLILLFLRGDAR